MWTTGVQGFDTLPNDLAAAKLLTCSDGRTVCEHVLLGFRSWNAVEQTWPVKNPGKASGILVANGELMVVNSELMVVNGGSWSLLMANSELMVVYPLVKTNSSLLKPWPIEIVDLPLKR